MSNHNPDQYSEQQSGLEPYCLKDEIAEWIDSTPIAQAIIDEMREQGLPLNLDNAKNVWYDILENLHSHLEVSIDRIRDRLARALNEGG